MPLARRLADRTLCAIVVLVAVAGCGGITESETPRPPPPVLQAAESFLARYVGADGRVVRWDQGGDTVSEGQAYAMVVASALHQKSIVDRVWAWTAAHLMQPNGLPAWRIDAEGRIADTQSAADADVLLAWALLSADDADRADLRAAGLRIAEAVLVSEVIVTPGGRHMLAAGPWAVPRGVVNVSYWSTAIFEDLAHQTGDQRWTKLAEDAPVLMAELTDGGRLLPPDWSQVTGETLVASASPAAVGSSPSDTPQYGLDAQRAVVWSAVSCQQPERQYSTAWHRLLQQLPDAGAMALALNGEILDPTTHPVPLVAAAAAADVAGASGEHYLEAAEAELVQRPTFFGSAWLALGRLLMDDRGALALCTG